MLKIDFILFFLISNTIVFGQYFNRYGEADTTKIFAINQYKYEIDTQKIIGNSRLLVLDSIEVKIIDYGNKIKTNSFFRNSKSNLMINFYFKDCKLVMADVKEQSPFFDDLAAFSIFYFDNDSIFYSDYYFSIRMCIAIPLGKSLRDLYGYNPNFTGDFLKKYVRVLLPRIITAAPDTRETRIQRLPTENFRLSTVYCNGSKMNDLLCPCNFQVIKYLPYKLLLFPDLLQADISIRNTFLFRKVQFPADLVELY